MSGLAYPGSTPGRIVAAWRQKSLDVVLSRHILDELVRGLPRLPRIRMTSAQIRDLADSFLFLADDLVTGDKDLLALAGRHPIIAPADYWSRHGA